MSTRQARSLQTSAPAGSTAPEAGRGLGGAVFAVNGRVQLDGCTFYENTADAGGAIYVVSGISPDAPPGSPLPSLGPGQFGASAEVIAHNVVFAGSTAATGVVDDVVVYGPVALSGENNFIQTMTLFEAPSGSLGRVAFALTANTTAGGPYMVNVSSGTATASFALTNVALTEALGGSPGSSGASGQTGDGGGDGQEMVNDASDEGSDDSTPRSGCGGCAQGGPLEASWLVLVLWRVLLTVARGRRSPLRDANGMRNRFPAVGGC